MITRSSMMVSLTIYGVFHEMRPIQSLELLFEVEMSFCMGIWLK